MSKVLESIAESDPGYRNSDNWLKGGWGSVTETSPDLYAGLTRISGEAPLFSERLGRRTSAGKSESLGRKTLFGINKLPLHKAPQL